MCRLFRTSEQTDKSYLSLARSSWLCCLWPTVWLSTGAYTPGVIDCSPPLSLSFFLPPSISLSYLPFLFVWEGRVDAAFVRYIGLAILARGRGFFFRIVLWRFSGVILMKRLSLYGHLRPLTTDYFWLSFFLGGEGGGRGHKKRRPETLLVKMTRAPIVCLLLCFCRQTLFLCLATLPLGLCSPSAT